MRTYRLIVDGTPTLFGLDYGQALCLQERWQASGHRAWMAPEARAQRPVPLPAATTLLVSTTTGGALGWFAPEDAATLLALVPEIASTP